MRLVMSKAVFNLPLGSAYDINDNYEISVWGKNLTDEEYTLSIIPFAGSGFAVFAPPTTYGVTLNARFE